MYPLPDAVNAFGVATPLGVSWAFWFLVVVLVVIALLLHSTVWGLSARATGSDFETAKCTEVDVYKVQLSAFLLSGALSACSGVLATMALGCGVYTMGTGWELIAIAACAIGGVSLFGYEGSMFGLFCGLATLQVIQTGIIILGISPYWQLIVIGSILLFSMVVDVRRRMYLNLEKI